MDITDDQEQQQQKQDQVERDFIAARQQLGADETAALHEAQHQAAVVEMAKVIEAELERLAPDDDLDRLADIAREAAQENIRQRDDGGEAIQAALYFEGLKHEPHSAERREVLSHPIPDDASPALIVRIHAAACRELDGMTGIDGDTFERFAMGSGNDAFERPELEAIAAMKAREIEAEGRLREIVQDKRLLADHRRLEPN